MSSITGIELGPDSCVLARVRAVAAAGEVSALHVVEPSAWSLDADVIAALRDIRRRKAFPRRAVVALWALTEPADTDAPHVRPLIRPLTSAGFRVDRVLTVPEALAALARTRPRPNGDAAVWLALNTQGAAIAIVRDAPHARPDAPSTPELLYSRVIDWHYSSEVVGQRAEMLQRYSLISHLAPEVRRGITAARNMHGVSVAVAITCGNLPDLRSLTMPLIEELELEVETLDSTEGLVSTGGARTDRFAESAPALRLAVGAAMSTASVASGHRQTVRTILGTAAAAAIVGGGLWVASRQLNRTTVRPAGARIVAANVNRVTPPPTRSTPPAPTAAQPPVTAPRQQTPPPAAPQKETPVPQPPVPQPKVAAPVTTQSPKLPPAAAPPPQTARPAVPTQATVTPPAKTPAPQVTQKSTAPQTASKPAPHTAPRPAPHTASLPHITPAPQKLSPSAQSVQTSAPPTAAKPQPAPVLPTPAPVFERRRDAEPRVDSVVLRPTPQPRRPIPLKEPVPSVESILIARDRRVAVVGGAIVSVGDSVGSRLVVQIERDTVVLREPSGYELRIPLRSAGVLEN